MAPPEPPADAAPTSKALAEIVVAIGLSFGVVGSLAATDAAPWRWLVELQTGWFGGDDPVATAGVLLIGVLCVLAPLCDFVGGRIRRR